MCRFPAGARLREARQQSGKSVAEIADHYCRTAKTVENWEAGRHVPPSDVLVRLSRDLDIPLEDLTMAVSQ